MATRRSRSPSSRAPRSRARAPIPPGGGARFRSVRVAWLRDWHVATVARAYSIRIACRPLALRLKIFGIVAVVAACGALAPAATAFKARGGIKNAYVLDAKKGQKLQLVDAHGHVVGAGRADRLGSKIFRDLKPGKGYRVRHGGKTTGPFKVLRAGENPPQPFYKHIKLKQGLNYVKMRDGVELAMTVRLPAGKKLSDGPFPTLMEYSGYQTA